MKVSGFTFIRNAVLLDYPILEAIRSILPLIRAAMFTYELGSYPTIPGRFISLLKVESIAVVV